jgi:hypothetical protein
MAVAVGMLWVNGGKLAPKKGNALSVQEAGHIKINH